MKFPHTLCLFLCTALALEALAVSLPEDPSQSIRYWKPQVIAPAADEEVALAHALFGQLLGAWDISRVEPSLKVVTDSAGPWAASLADGHILLSRAAIDICLGFGRQRGEHLLAFILAHELAHQKGNDLWHQQFFRLIGNQSPERTDEIRRDLALDENRVAQLESIEAQADLDAVVMMASVGYDPYQIVRDKDFYTSWIENIWQTPCSEDIAACQKARERALRTRAQLESISDQAIFYTLGIQSLVAKNYQQARSYLTAYARNFPGRSVHNSIGVSYLAEAIDLWPRYARETGKAKLHFPLFIEAQPAWRANSVAAKRGSAAQLKATLNTLAERALSYFDKAQRLSPQHRHTHYLRALSYLLMENSPMANGIIEGQYIPRFGRDASSALLKALSLAIAGNPREAERQLGKALRKHLNAATARDYPLLFAMAHNQADLAAGNKSPAAAKQVWKHFAQAMGKQGQGYLLQLALAQLKNAPAGQQGQPPLTLKYRNIALNASVHANRRADKKIWFEGSPLTIHRDSKGTWLSNDRGKVVALWLDNGDFSGLDRLSLGDPAERVIRAMGPADRQIHLTAGDYLAYDKHGLAVRVSHNKIDSWFLYAAEREN